MKKENLVHHMKVIHTQEKEKLQCNWCGKTNRSEHSHENHYKSNCIKRYEEEGEITPQMMFEAEMMVRGQAQNLIQGLNTPIPTIFPDGDGGKGVEVAELSQESKDSVMELSQYFCNLGWIVSSG